MHYVYEYKSPIGAMTVASDGQNVTGLWLLGQKYYGHSLPEDSKKGHIPVFDRVREWLDGYFAGDNPALSLPLAPQGKPFSQSVWKVLCAIPYGEVTTYGEIAKKIAKRLGRASMSAQAVGGVVGHNPISVIIPCHRVVGSDGSLTGYAGGVDKKQWLLRLEKAAVPSLDRGVQK